MEGSKLANVYFEESVFTAKPDESEKFEGPTVESDKNAIVQGYRDIDWEKIERETETGPRPSFDDPFYVPTKV